MRACHCFIDDVDPARLVVAAAAGDVGRRRSTMRLDSTPSATSSSRTALRALLREVHVGRRVAGLVGVAGDDDLRADADVRGRRDADGCAARPRRAWTVPGRKGHARRKAWRRDRRVARSLALATVVVAGGVYAAAFTSAPGESRTPPSTTTLSPLARPSETNQPSPFHSPTVTGRSSALFSLFTTQTKWPFALCCTARCGTTTAFGRIEPVRRTRTYWFGPQHAGRIVHRRAQQERAGGRVVRRIRERDRRRCTGRGCRRPSPLRR